MLLGDCLSVYGWVRCSVKLSLLAAVLSGGVAGIAGAGIMARLATPVSLQVPVSTEARSETMVPRGVNAVGPLLDRIRELEARVTKLANSKASTGSARKVHGASLDQANMKQAQGGIPLEASGLAKVTAQAILEDGSPVRGAVVGIIQDEIKNRRAEWHEYARARGEARDEERLGKMSETVELSEATRGRLLDLMNQERKQVRALRHEVRETMDFKGLREKRKTIQAATDETVSDFLEQSELEAWGEMRSTPRRRRWR
jgi:hypothetical protein